MNINMHNLERLKNTYKHIGFFFSRPFEMSRGGHAEFNYQRIGW